MKKIFSKIAILLGTVIVFTIFLFFYFTQTEKITKKTGKFFDDSGKQLSYCTIETKWEKLSTEPSYRTIYYNLDQSKIGSCEGDSGTKIDPERKSEPTICNQKILQEKCDPLIYTNAYPFCSKAKYKCNTEMN